MVRHVIMMFRRKMYSTQMKRTVQIVKCIYMSEPHEQSLTVFITDNHAKIFFGEVKVDFDMLLKLLWKVIQKWQGKFIWSIGFAKLSYCSEEKTRWQTCSNKRVQITESVFILIKLVTCPIFVTLISLKQFIKRNYFLKLFHCGKITKATFIMMCFCISLVFMPAWSRDNPYQIITFDCTDDIHLHYFCQSLPLSGEV